ncbi:hypothetical protein [Mycolicibacter virginiensis]|uniref:hypothetical protein n=1 Tax=Mycolicibacter virginiensis TaxID=1795032 RepID=UPI001F04C5C8|nr:hypothetical protein [Mycolicibacter virginiensis]ULP48041.1 hypothetical protein MJO54_02395 [Mycolicibacter virginiensis]
MTDDMTAAVAAADAEIAARATELRAQWTAELTRLRERCRPGDLAEHSEHFLSRLEPSGPRSMWWAPYRVTSETTDAAIALVVDGGVRRYVADAESDARYEISGGGSWSREMAP